MKWFPFLRSYHIITMNFVQVHVGKASKGPSAYVSVCNRQSCYSNEYGNATATFTVQVDLENLDPELEKRKRARSTVSVVSSNLKLLK